MSALFEAVRRVVSEPLGCVVFMVTMILVFLRILVEVRNVLAERRSERLLRKQLEEIAKDPPVIVDPAELEAQRQELLANGYSEPYPGVFTKPEYPDYWTDEQIEKYGHRIHPELGPNHKHTR